jgi:predicted amino acid racemase
MRPATTTESGSEDGMPDETPQGTSEGLQADKRTLIKKLAAGTAFAVPLILSYSVKDLAHGQVGSVTTQTVTGTATTVSTTTTVTTVFTTTTLPIP